MLFLALRVTFFAFLLPLVLALNHHIPIRIVRCRHGLDVTRDYTPLLGLLLLALGANLAWNAFMVSLSSGLDDVRSVHTMLRSWLTIP